jgi:hypothetical protein
MIRKATQRTRKAHGAKCDHCKTRHGDGAPWWNESKQGWSVTLRIDGKPRNRLLAKGWEGHDEAIRIWKERTAEETAARPISSLDNGEDLTIEELVHYRLEYIQNNDAESTYTNNKAWLNDFCYHPKFGFAKTTIRELRKEGIARIKQWMNSHQWNNTTKASAYKVIKALFNFATDRSEDGLGIIESSPIAKLNTGRHRVRAGNAGAGGTSVAGDGGRDSGSGASDDYNPCPPAGSPC